MRARIGLLIAGAVVGCAACVAQSHVGTTDLPAPAATPSPPTSAVPPVAPQAAAGSQPRRMSQIAIANHPNEMLGEHSEILGDLDGDGYDDFMLLGRRSWLSEEEQATSTGTFYEHAVAYLFYGKSILPGDLSTAKADAVFQGSIALVSGVGDVNGDRRSDFAIIDADGVRIVLGNATRFQGTIAPAAVGIQWTQDELPELLRSSALLMVQRAGDLNGDGFDDMFVHVADNYSIERLGDSPELSGRYQMRVYVVLGRAAAWPSGRFDPSLAQATFEYASWGDQWTSPFPVAVGDLNGDGFDDVRVSTWAEHWFYYGGPDVFTGEVGEAQAAFMQNEATFGRRMLFPIGDFDGDGYDDLASPDPKGAVVYYGRAERWSDADPPVPSLTIERTFDPSLGQTIGAVLARDLDADGHADLVLVEDMRFMERADGSARTTDAIYLVRGSGVRLEGTYVLQAENLFAEGSFLDVQEIHLSTPNLLIDGGGDVDGDGSADLLVGAPGAAEDHPNFGKVLLFARTPIEPQ